MRCQFGIHNPPSCESQNFSGHLRAPCNTRKISTTFPRTRYGKIYGAPATTSSLVPATRPARPIAGLSFNNSASAKIRNTIRPAAAGLSSAMYSPRSSRFASAAFNHLTRTLYLGGGGAYPVTG